MQQKDLNIAEKDAYEIAASIYTCWSPDHIENVEKLPSMKQMELDPAKDRDNTTYYVIWCILNAKDYQDAGPKDNDGIPIINWEYTRYYGEAIALLACGATSRKEIEDALFKAR